MLNIKKVLTKIPMTPPPRCFSSSPLLSSAPGSNPGVTTDPESVATFSQIADIWWDVDGPLRGLHTFNEYRVPFILGSSSGTASDTQHKILDIGCGGGLLSEALAERGNIVTGIDVTPDLIVLAKKHSEINHNLKIKPTYYYTAIEDHAEEYANHYDKVVASEVIEHVTNKELFIRSCVKALKPGGSITITCPTKSRICQLVNIMIAENILRCPPRGTHLYDLLISPQGLQDLLEKNGCKVEETRGFAYNMFTNAWSRTRSTSLFFATRAIKLR